MFRSDMKVELLDSMGTEQSIVRAARTSTLGTKAEPKEAQGLVKFLVREGHLVPLEHCVLTFRLEVPIFVSRQIVKHRTSSISEESGRYRVLDSEFYLPLLERPVKQVGKTGDYRFEQDSALNLATRNVMRFTSEEADFSYRKLLEAGVAKEVARMVLPVNTYSTMVMTMNLRNWLQFLGLRSSYGKGHPQYEIALVADQIAEIIKEKFPTVFGAWFNA